MEHWEKQQRGLLLIISGPSGSGKTTLEGMLEAEEAHILQSISATTRPQRENERDGVDYFFMEKEDFEQKITEGYFLEYAEFNGNLYGTPRAYVEGRLEKGEDVVLNIETIGARQVAEAAPEDVVRIFLLPPSLEVLQRRLFRRKTDSLEVIKQRVESAREEMRTWEEYDYVVINKDLDGSLRKIKQILRAERMRRKRHPWLPEFVEELCTETISEE